MTKERQLDILTQLRSSMINNPWTIFMCLHLKWIVKDGSSEYEYIIKLLRGIAIQVKGFDDRTIVWWNVYSNKPRIECIDLAIKSLES